ncbi:beta strand repeat-containing protein, partial [Methylobacterium persicinum]
MAFAPLGFGAVALAKGGVGGEGAAGGTSSTTGTGSAGGDATGTAGGGGGGAGQEGGSGGKGGAGSKSDPIAGGVGGATVGAAGGNGGANDYTQGIGGGGGGAHGYVGDTAPTTATTGGNGGNGGTILINHGSDQPSSGGGGGEGGFGAVLTGTGPYTITTNITGGKGGNGADGTIGGAGGDGGVGLALAASGASVTVNDGVTIKGGTSGLAGYTWSTDKSKVPAYALGGVGITGANVTLILSAGATVSAGAGAEGSKRNALAIEFTSGTNVLELQGNGTTFASLTGTVIARGSDNTLKLTGHGAKLDMSSLMFRVQKDPTYGGVFQGFGTIVVETDGKWMGIGYEDTAGDASWVIKKGTFQLGSATTRGSINGFVTVQDGGTFALVDTSTDRDTITSISKDLVVQSGGTLSIKSVSNTVSLKGKTLTLQAGSNLTLDLTKRPSAPIVMLTGAFSYQGSLTIAALPATNAVGTYNLIKYGTAPAATDAFSSIKGQGGYTYATSLDASQNTLMLTVAWTPQYWNGGTTTGKAGPIVGGTGTWTADSTVTNWTYADGTDRVASTNLTGAIFAGTGGIVTVSNAKGGVSSESLTFAVDGYVITGDDLTLSTKSGGPKITVADGAISARIAASLKGTQGLELTGGGTLILTGQNDYGDTTISAGTLRIGDGGKSGWVAGSITNNGKLIIDRADDVTFSATITGNGSLEKRGAGTLALSGRYDYAGATLISAGTLALNGGGPLTLAGGGTLSGSLTVASDATLAVGGFAKLGSLAGAGAVTIAEQATFFVGGDNTSTEFSGTISGKGGLQKTFGNGTLTLSGANTYTGGLRVGSGGVVLRGGAANDKGNAITVDYGATLEIVGGNAAASGIIRSNAGAKIKLNENTLTIGESGSKSYTFAGEIEGSGGLAKVGTNQQILSGTNSFTGPVTISGGRLLLADSSRALPYKSAVTVEAGGTLILTGNTASIGSLAGSGKVIGETDSSQANGSLPPGVEFSSYLFVGYDDTSTTFSGVLANGAKADQKLGLTKFGSGTLTLTGENTFTAGTAIDGGTLRLGDGGKSGSISGNVVNSGTLAFNRADDVTYAGVVSGTGSLEQKGPGTLTLTGVNTLTGMTTVSGGTLVLAGGSVAGAVTVQSGATLSGDPTGATAGSIGGALTVQDGGMLRIASGSQNLTTAGDLTLSGSALTALSLGAPTTTAAVSVGGNLTLGGRLNLTTAGGITTGTYRIFDYTGKLSDTGLTVGNAPADSLVSVDTTTDKHVDLKVAAGRFWAGPTTGGGTWSANGTNWSDRDGTGATAWTPGALAIFAGPAGKVTVSDGATPSVAALSFTTDGYALAGGAIDLAGFAGSKSTRITVEDKNATGGGTAVIASDLTGPGALAKEGTGTLVLTGAKTYAGGTAVSAGTLQLGDGTASGSVTGDIVDNAALVFAPGADQTFAGVISGTGTLVKQGPGTLTLTGTNLYTGATTVSAGALAVSGSLASAVSVASGATLRGTGTVGSVTVASRGTLAGVQGQTLTTGDLTLAPGSHLVATLGGSAGTTALLAVKGDLRLGGTLDVSSTTGSFGGGLYRLISYTGTTSGNGLAMGTIGGSVDDQDLSVQSDEAAKTVSLLVQARATSFWKGGDGSWGAGTAWTNAQGGASTTAADRAIAVFTGTPGKVTVDASAGPVTTGGMQFAASGYTVQGDPLTLTSASTQVRVGDGTKAGASTVATIASPLSGTGGLRKTDGGTLVLTGANSFTGGTSVETGTLKVGHPQALGTGALSLNEGTTLAFAGDLTLTNAIRFPQKGDPIIDSGTGTVTIAGEISGVGDLSKIGSGTLILSGTETYTGATDVVSGTLVANGSLAASSGVTVESGATLGGSGTVPRVSALTGSIVAPGVATPYSTLNVAGSVSFAAGSTFRVQVDAAGHTDAIAATGTATLSGGTVDVRAGTGTYTASQSYRILNAAGGLSGRFASLQTTTNLAFLQPILNYDATGASLGFTRATNGGTGGSTAPGGPTAPGGTGGSTGSGGSTNSGSTSGSTAPGGTGGATDP